MVVGFSLQMNTAMAQREVTDNTIKIMIQLEKKVDMTASGQQVIEDALHNFYDEMKNMMSSGSRPDRDQMQSLKNDCNRKVQAVLSSSDFETFKKIMESMKGKSSGERSGRGGGGGRRW